MDNNELVIKAKYGDTLRRFSVATNGNGSFVLDMAGLRAKIFGLFKLNAESDVTLTYVDEDNDIVTLVDDADLRDAVKQGLDPLRINVSVDSDNAGSERSAPLSSVPSTRPPYYPYSPRVRPPRGPRLPYMNYMAPPFPPQGLPPMPQQFIPQQQSSHDALLKASSSTEGVPKQEQLLSKLFGDLASKVASAAPDKYRDLISECSLDVINAAVAASSTSTLMRELVETLSKMGSTKEDVPPSDPVVTDLKKSEERNTSGNLKESETLSNGKKEGYDNAGFVQQKNDMLCGQMGPSCSNPGFSTGVPLQSPAAVPVAPQYVNTASGQMGSLMAPGAVSSMPVRRSYGNSDNMGRIFHQGVVCDGCGVHPITGPRYKSKVKDDYDLCSICFAELGNDSDYNKIDRPLSYRTSGLLKRHPRVGRSLGQLHCLRNRGFTSHHPKLDSRFTSHHPKFDSRFIEDVNIVDGTLLAPSTRFTKIWRMHNNGAVPWPVGTQLTWIGGDQLTDAASFEVELPVHGCHVGMYLNVAIDFTAPESPGQYVSYWRMALPSGQMFGQYVWVLIQVDTQRDSIFGSSRSLNLNLPPDSLDLKNQDNMIDINAEPADASQTEYGFDMASESVKPLIEGFASEEMEPPTNVLSNHSDNSASARSEVPTPEAAYPEIPAVPSAPGSPFSDFPGSASSPIPVPDMQTESAVLGEDSALEQSLLKELAAMGFKEIDLNKEILRVNDYNLDKALDDLCDVSEWDPMLDELKEMGFRDKETNRKLLIKFGGSIKRVVLDLISAEKEKQL